MPKEAALPHPAFKSGAWRRRTGQSCFEKGPSGISIEIRPKIIYLDTIRFVYLIFDFPWEKLPLKK
jgi:hypothetical protein